MINVMVPVNAQSKAWVCGLSLAGVAGPESPTDFCVSECDREASKMRRS